MFPAGPSFLSPSAIAVDPVAWATDDAAQLLDIDVQEISRSRVLVPSRRLGRLKGPKPSHTALTKDPADRGLRQAYRL